MDGTGGKYTIQEMLEAKAEENWRRKGVSEKDIEFSRWSGMDAGDIRGFLKYTVRQPGYLVIARCPKLTARPHYNTFQSKPGYAAVDREGRHPKSGDSGLLVYKGETAQPDGTKVPKDKLFVSDYDLMSIWRRGGKGFEKIFVSAAGGAKRGKFTPDATIVVRELNWCMESRARIQHGCQDDWNSPDNPGIKAGDHFAAFNVGKAEHFDSPIEVGIYYNNLSLPFPYDGNGKYKLSKPA
jgi:hypothetical protein